MWGAVNHHGNETALAQNPRTGAERVVERSTVAKRWCVWTIKARLSEENYGLKTCLKTSSNVLL